MFVYTSTTLQSLDLQPLSLSHVRCRPGGSKIVLVLLTSTCTPENLMLRDSLDSNAGQECESTTKSARSKVSGALLRSDREVRAGTDL